MMDRMCPTCGMVISNITLKTVEMDLEFKRHFLSKTAFVHFCAKPQARKKNPPHRTAATFSYLTV